MASPDSARSGEGLNLVVVAPGGLVGEALVEALAAVEWPLAALHVLDHIDRASGRVEFPDAYRNVGDVAAFDFSGADLVFFCDDASLAAQYARRCVEQGCTVIDMTGFFADDNTVPVAAPDLDGGQVDAHGPALYAVANPVAAALSRLLAGLGACVRVERMVGDLLLPVSAEGRAGVDELAAQTVALLNLKQAVSKTYPAQIAFNLLTQAGHGGGDNAVEDSLRRQIHRLTLMNDVVLHFTAISVPIFYGYACSMTLTLDTPVTTQSLSNWFSGLSGFAVDTGEEAGALTPVTHAVNQQDYRLGRIRPLVDDPRSFSVWMVGDNIRQGWVREALGIASILVKRLI